MNRIEKLISCYEKFKVQANENGPQSFELIKSKDNLDYAQILQLLISERKKLWQSVLDFIEMIERTENEFKLTLELNNKTNNVDEEEEFSLNRTFVKNDKKQNDNRPNNLFLSTSPFGDFESNNLSPNTYTNNSIKLVSTPMPCSRKVQNVQRSELTVKRKKRDPNQLSTFPTIDEVDEFN